MREHQQHTLHWSRGRARSAGLALMIAAAAVVSTPRANAVPKDRQTDRVVHGTIGKASLPTLSTAARDWDTTGPLAPATTTAARCVLSDTTRVIEDIRPGHVFELTADEGPWKNDFDIAFYRTPTECQGLTPPPGVPYANAAGDERAVVPADAALAVVTLVTGSDGAAFTYREQGTVKVRVHDRDEQRPTVIAVMELAEANGFNPYHFDFLGHQHPWNNDDDLENDLDFGLDPSSWFPGYPTGTAAPTSVELTLPSATQADAEVASFKAADQAAWSSLRTSTRTTTNLYRFPGTKIVGAAQFSSTAKTASFYGDNIAHGTKSAAVAGGNTSGTCPECVFVLVLFDAVGSQPALEWVSQQPWIDVVTNSWANSTYASIPSDFGHRVIRPAVEAGQRWFWGAGNGPDGEMTVPNQTYLWPDHSGDWNILVGGVSNPDDREQGTGKPVHISSYSNDYPSPGGTTAAGRGGHAGTSNATPVVAGTYAKIVQLGRELVGDTTPGHQDGILAQGTPRPCEGALEKCPLDNGVLTRAEAQAVLFGNVLPSSVRPGSGSSGTAFNGVLQKNASSPPVAPSMSQGHGIVRGRWDQGRFEAESRRFLDAVRGAVVPFRRPPGEHNWMVADSRCRQSLRGPWTGGYYKQGDPPPTFDPTVDHLAIALNTACTHARPVCTGGAVTFCLDPSRPPR